MDRRAEEPIQLASLPIRTLFEAKEIPKLMPMIANSTVNKTS